jgi:hypothetical protein
VFTVLAHEWRGLLFPHLTNKLFPDAYAQTVTFALLLARVEGIDFTNRSVGEIALLLGKKHSLMGKALTVLTQDSVEGDSIVVDTMIRVIGVVEWDEFGDEAYPLLYEKFLEAYDPDLRKESGSYYTPVEVVRFMTRFVDDVLCLKLERKTGFAANDVIVVDPAMGTGSFLEQIVHRVADVVTREEGPGQVPPRLRSLSQRLIGFENQAAPYAVAELRLHSSLKAKYRAEIPDEECRFLSDALDNPDLQELHFGTIYEAIARSRRGANRIKRNTPVMVVIGNPPYLEKARGRAPWIEERGADFIYRPGLDAFRARGLGKYEYVLSNLYVYFWRWATWKVFDAHPESPGGIVAFITTASYLNGPGFAGMREYLRRTSDEGWIVDLSPEGHRPDIGTRIFPTNQHPICIGVFVRQGQPRPDVASTIRYATVSGSQGQKFERLTNLSLNDGEWLECQNGWHEPFAPKLEDTWTSYPLLGDLFPWCAPGVKTNRTWVYAPIQETLIRRWNRLIAATAQEKSILFKESRDANLTRIVKPLAGRARRSYAFISERGSCPAPVRIAYRSFDRQWLIPDSRLHHAPSPDLWRAHSAHQVYITEQHAHPIINGPALTFCSLIPDMDHYNNRGGRVLPLYRDPSAQFANLAPGLRRVLSNQLGVEITPEDVLAYVACIVAHPEFTTRHQAQLTSSPVRVPLTAESSVWRDAVKTGRRVLWLHTFGDRFVDLDDGRPRGIPYLPVSDRPRVETVIQGEGEPIPDTISYDPASLTLHIGHGRVHPVPEQVWMYEVSGMRVIKRWFDYRKNRPRIRRGSPLDDIRPAAWDANLTGDLLDMLNVLGGCIMLEPCQASILHRVLRGPKISVLDLERQEIFPILKTIRKPVRVPIDPTLPRADDE